ncbi:MAG: caspase family protein [Flavobacteriales bacterium]|nr:caspase family protein [Flavobacteriales bacterium]
MRSFSIGLLLLHVFPCAGQTPDAETGWPALFGIHAAEPTERRSLVLAEGYSLRDSSDVDGNIRCYQYAVDLVQGSNQWEQRIKICNDAKDFVYMTEKTIHWQELKQQLVEVYGFEEPKDGNVEEQTYVRDSSVVVFSSREGRDHLTKHYIWVKRIHDDAGSACTPDPTRSAYHALLIGTQNYADPTYEDLKWPHAEVKELEQVLRKRYGFQCTVLKDPTRAQIIQALELKRSLTCDDDLIIFFAGHGEEDKGAQRGYWLPSDADPENRSRHISSSDLRDQIRALSAGHVLLISDVCYGGAIFRENLEMNPVEAVASDTDLDDLMTKRSRRVMTSGDVDLVPDDSFFFHSLLRTLEKNDRLFLESSHLYDQVIADIKQARQTDPGAQIPKPQYGRLMNTGDRKGDLVLRLTGK